MKDRTEIVFWQRTDTAGLERMSLREEGDLVLAESTVIGTDDGGYRLDHRWKMLKDWQVLSVEVEKWDAREHERLQLERVDNGWTVNGVSRPDLDGTDEPDLSVTPFCNTLPIRRLMRENAESITLEICFIDAASMVVTRSRQRYDRVGRSEFRYVDLVLSAGFKANVQVDDQGLVVSYQGLFRRLYA